MGKELFDNIPSKVGDLLSDVKNGKVTIKGKTYTVKNYKVTKVVKAKKR